MHVHMSHVPRGKHKKVGRAEKGKPAMIQSLRGSWFREAFVVVREQTLHGGEGWGGAR